MLVPSSLLTLSSSTVASRVSAICAASASSSASATTTLPLAVVTVKQGQAGISYDGGALVVLPTGRHVMPAATQLFAGFLSLGQQVLNISEVVSMTSDNVGISFDAGKLAVAGGQSVVSVQVLSGGCNTHNGVSVPSLSLQQFRFKLSTRAKQVRTAPAAIKTISTYTFHCTLLRAVTMLCPVQDDSSRPFKISDLHNTIVEKAKLGLTISECSCVHWQGPHVAHAVHFPPHSHREQSP